MSEHQPLLRIDDLSVDFETASGRSRVVEQVSLDVAAGERFALVGESGSGKTVTAMSVLRLNTDAHYQGSIRLDGRDLLELSERQMRGVRGNDVAMIFQEPMSALDPLYTIGDQICETLELHEGMTRTQAMSRAIDLLKTVRINEPAQRAQAYPHQLSGGQRQRAMIAMALACEPRLLIADEPTTALDVTIQRQIIDLLLDLQTRLGMAILLITHDLPLVRRFAQRVAVMRNGRIVETGETAAIFSAPADPYTRRLIDSRPKRTIQDLPPLPASLAAMLSGAGPAAGHGERPVDAGKGPASERPATNEGHPGITPLANGSASDTVDPPLLLTARGVSCQYRYREGWFGSRPVDVVRQVDAVLRKGETLGIVGESGSGKTTLGLSLLKLSASRLLGEVAFDGQRIDSMTERQLRPLRRRMQVVFQDPFNSLSPRMTVEQLIGEGLALHQPALTRQQRRDRIVAMLHEVGLQDGGMLNRYPHEFSGGQRQRLSIARAVILQPDLILLDEPTSALDVSVQSQVLELLSSLQRKYGLSYLFITHDLAVIRAMAHRVVVMKDGAVVETAGTETLFNAPREPYTRALLGAAAL